MGYGYEYQPQKINVVFVVQLITVNAIVCFWNTHWTYQTIVIKSKAISVSAYKKSSVIELPFC